MAQWYYAEGPAQNVGPLSSEELVALFRRGQLPLDTPVWREGMPQWQALRHVAAELGLDGTTASQSPPPLPGAWKTASPQRPQYVAPEPRRMSRGVLVLIVCLALIVPVLAVLGILAAIAIPAYHDYTLRTKVLQPISAGNALKQDVQNHVAAHGQCPANGEAGFKAPEAYAAESVEAVTIGEFEGGTCGIEVRVRGLNPSQLDGRAIWLEFDPDSRQWTCTSEIDDRYLPVQCRG